MDWQTLRNQFMRHIGGDPPGAALEDQLIQMYTDHPEALERSIEKITLAFKAGKIRSPWGALKAEAEKAVDTARNPTHSQATRRSSAVQRAEQWMRNAGMHHDTEAELLDELYGERGRLREHPETQDRMLALWRELRPVGEQLDQDAIDRGHRYIEQKTALAQLKPGETPDEANTRQKKLAAQKAALG